MLTQARLKELFHYCPESGLFTRLISTSNRTKIGEIAGNDAGQGYLRVMVDREFLFVHRLAWFYMNGEWPNKIDHINGIRDDNKAINLRSVDDYENSRNKGIHKNNKSGVIGVSRCRQGWWRVLISGDGKRLYLGEFEYKWDAICIRKSAEIKYGYHENHGRNG